MSCCCIDPDNYPEFTDVTLPKARKAHVCCECSGPINPGDVYEYTVGSWDGDFCTFKTCKTCKQIREDYFPCGFHYGELAEDLYEYCGVYLTCGPENEPRDD